eukprot:XP_011670053.1 PREDICTED: uncharacterized protein LOC105441034 [Strongylocentrotus purpuratus]
MNSPIDSRSWDRFKTTRAATSHEDPVSSTSSAKFRDHDEDGNRAKREKKTTTRRSNVSGSTTSTKSSWKSTTSSETSKKPLRQRPTIITKKTLARQKFYNSVYNNQHYKIQRQTAFLKKVEKAQLKIDDEKTREIANAQERKHESVVRQYQTLKHIRDKFDEEQVKRFSRQYVSWRSVEEDRLNRQSSMYGLPDNIYEDSVRWGRYAISEVSNEDAFDDDDGYSDVSSLDLSDDE